MDETPLICNQENNQLLLNAIRNKFAAQETSETALYSPPKFNIPVLKTADASTERQKFSLKFLENLESCQDSSSTSPVTKPTTPTTKQSLNDFILGQLQEKKQVSATGFVLPALKLGKTEDDSGNVVSFPAALSTGKSCKTTANYETNISTLSKELHHLNFKEKTTTPATTIDLTAALSNHSVVPRQRNVPACAKSLTAVQDFDIPFIECDLKEQTVMLPLHQEYCQPDISHLKFKHSLVAPSSFARITCLKFKRMRRLPYIDHSFKAKHVIQCFRFDTKSPDDIILSKLQKYQR